MWSIAFVKRYWLGTVILMLATLVFFWPIVTRLSSYSEGGDAMFNAWTLARDHHCILREGCPKYVDGNIFFPHKDTMLYSETQLSTGLLTLPLHLVNPNPIFANNAWTIISFFLIGWTMYMLAMYLSRQRQLVAIAAGLVFEFAPFRMAGIFHLQNISIYFLPLCVLFVLKYVKTQHRRYLGFLLGALILQFYASWYNMVFVAATVAFLAGALWLLKSANLKQLLTIGAVLALAALSTYPLAKEYIRFSKANKAAFSIGEQTLYASSVADYFIPNSGTLLGKAYYHLHPNAHMNAYNLDSVSYHSITLYAVGAGVVFLAYRQRKESERDKRLFHIVIALAVVGIVGVILSLGPLLKFKGHYDYAQVAQGFRLVIPAPYLLIDKFLPQLSFIRAVGRWSVLCLLALCSLFALSPYYLERFRYVRERQRLIYTVLLALLVIELMPVHFMPMNHKRYSYNLSVPGVYKYVQQHKEVDNIIIIAGDSDYPGAPIPIMDAERVLWSGYHNRNIFNGYSGYQPPSYLPDYIEFKDLDSGDLAKMRSYGLKYLIIDKELSQTRPELIQRTHQLLPSNAEYEDNRYALFKL